MTDDDVTELEATCRDVRGWILREIGSLGVGHVGGSLSLVEALVTLYWRHLRVDPADPAKVDRDRFVLSKGHSGPGYYAVLACRGYFDREELLTLNQWGTRLLIRTDAAGGSQARLGHLDALGLAYSIGFPVTWQIGDIASSLGEAVKQGIIRPDGSVSDPADAYVADITSRMRSWAGEQISRRYADHHPRGASCLWCAAAHHRRGRPPCAGLCHQPARACQQVGCPPPGTRSV